MIEKIKISSLVILGLLPNYLLYKFSYPFNFAEILVYIIYTITALFIIFRKQTNYLFKKTGMFFIVINLGIFLYFNHKSNSENVLVIENNEKHNSENVLVIENNHHQIKFTKRGNCILKETCDNINYQYAYEKYELMGDTIIIKSKQLNSKNFNRLSIRGKKVKLISEDEKKNNYFTFDIVEDNRNKKP